MEYLADKNDCEIEIHDNKKYVYDSEGEVIFFIEYKTPDLIIWQILRIINTYYDLGIKRGKTDKIHEIKKVLDL